jgi:hypothetical protein
LGHAFHRNDDFLINKGQGFIADAEFFRAHHDRGGLGVIGLAKVHGLFREMGGIEPKAFGLQGIEAAGRVLVPDQFDPALGATGGVVEPGDTATRWYGMSLHDAGCIAGAQDGGNIMGLVDALHEHRQVGLAAGGDLANPDFAFRCHGVMVAAMMRRLILLLFLYALCSAMAVAREADEDPDFEDFMLQMQHALDSAGAGNYPGDRSELYRYAESGWEMQMMMVWDGEGWLMLALRLHHPERIDSVEGQWQQRYERLLAELDREMIETLDLPELFDVPAPGWNPALPGELRSRRFTYQGFWYEARWINVGGLDEGAEWALRSYELVAIP